MFGTIQDITERKKAEEALRRSEEKYRTLIAATQQGILVHRKYKILFANRALVQLLGYASLEELWATDLREFYRPEDRSSVEARHEAMLSGENQPQYFERRLVRKDQASIWTEMMAIKVNWEGTPAVLAVIEDITERKQAEEERVRLAAEVENVAETIFITDAAGIIQYVNSAIEGTGHSRREVLGKSPSLFIDELESSAPYGELIESMLLKEAGSVKLHFRQKDGGRAEMAVTVSPIRNELGKVESHVTVARSISREVQLERMLRQAAKMEALGTLSGGVAHDFNSALGIIINNGEMALEDAMEGIPAVANIELVLKGAKRAAELVKQILAFSRRTDLEFRAIQIAPVVRETLQLLQSTLPSSVEIRSRIDDVSQPVLADSIQIHQVVINLCTNSVQAMEENGGVLEVCVSKVHLDTNMPAYCNAVGPGDFLMLTVGDSGIGMEKEVLDRIFDPFFTTKEQGVGTGIGLAMVHSNVLAHNGGIIVDSAAGKGTTFQIYLPLSEREADPQPEILDDMPMGSGRILLVDDQPDMMETIPRVFERLGYEVKAVTSGNEALECFVADPTLFDLVITDQTMPHLTGLELAKRISGIRPEIPIILYTGFSEKVTAAAVQSAGIREVLLKPVQIQQWAQTFHRVMKTVSRKEGDTFS